MNKLILYSVLVFLISCNNSKEITQNINAKQSAQIIVALNHVGIQSERVLTSSGRKTEYKVLVSNNDYARALEILTEYELPKKESKEFETLINDSSYLSSDLNSIKVNRALSLELERLLMEFPGVISANVLVRTSGNSASIFNESSEQTSSVVIKYFSSQPSKMPFNEGQILKIIEKALPGIKKEDVALNLIRVEPPNSWLSKNLGAAKLKYVRPFAFRVPQEDLNRAKYQIIGVLVLICFAGFLLGGVSFLIWLRKRYSNKQVSSVLLEDENTNIDMIE